MSARRPAAVLAKMFKACNRSIEKKKKKKKPSQHITEAIVKRKLNQSGDSDGLEEEGIQILELFTFF